MNKEQAGARQEARGTGKVKQGGREVRAGWWASRFREVKSRRGKLGWLCGLAVVGLAATALLTVHVAAQSGNVNGHILAKHTPGFVARATDMGPEDSSKMVTVTLWLRMQNADALHALVQQLYDPNSSNYHHWLTQEQFNASYAPKAEEAAAVQKFLAGRNLSPVSTGEHNFYVEAQGAVADLQKAFHVQINKFNTHGETFRANISDPVIDDPAGAHVVSVGGLHDYRPRLNFVRPSINGQPPVRVAVSASTNGLFFSPQCFREPEFQSFTTNGALPKAFYFGNRYGADITNTTQGQLPPCGYAPSDIQTAYKLKQLYKQGLDGTGQSVVIVDPCGSPTIQADAELFSQVYGLPDLTPSNFKITGAPAPGCDPTGAAAGETTLDVEWAHATAPGATIHLVVSPSFFFDDLDAAILTAVTNHFGNVISNSYGAPETLLDASVFNPTDAILEMAAAEGIAVNYSSGDNGDWSNLLGYIDVQYPATSPFATAVGGTSLALKPDKSIAFQTGWGNNATILAAMIPGNTVVAVPPSSLGFQGGAGGGSSGVYAKRSFQKRLPGSARLIPDISYLADPFTGVEDIQTFGTQQFVSLVGGTSLSCPMFSALWAIAAQRAHEPLGQAAHLVYRLPENAVTDVVPFPSFFNVSGATITSTAFNFYFPDQLAAPLGNTKEYVNALYNFGSPQGLSGWFVLTFGTDSSLTTAVGWDNVTGVGTPNGEEFVEGVVQRE